MPRYLVRHSSQGMQPIRPHRGTGLNAALQPSAPGVPVAIVHRPVKRAVQLTTVGLGDNLRK